MTQTTEWIKVSDRVPKPPEELFIVLEVIVYNGKSVFCCEFFEGKFSTDHDPEFEEMRQIHQDITHWQYLPEPPQAATK